MPRNLTLPGVYLGTEHSSTGSQVWKTNSLGTRKTIAGDVGHYGYPDFPPNRIVGGTFVQHNEVITLPLCNVGQIWRGGSLDTYYEGSFAAAAYPPIGSCSQSDASSRAAEAYNKMKPTKPSWPGLNAIYELREVPEMLSQRFLKNGLAGIGDYYLALQFGWKPLLQDIRNCVLTQINMQKRLNWLISHNGKPVRRNILLAETSNVDQQFAGYALSAMQPILVSQYYASTPRYGGTHQSGERWWANARFRYWLPEGPRDIVWRRSMMANLFGLKPTPAVIYNALPWTWMIDWFTNAGDVLANMDAGVANRCAADYFYIMRHNWARCEFNASGTFRRQSGEIVPASATSSYLVEHKSRIQGDPFGFNTSDNQLTGMQLSILGALGLSRVRSL